MKMNLREERIQELTDLIAARMPPRKISFTATTTPTLLPAYDWFSANALALEPVILDQTAKARCIRKIMDLASRYPWGRVVVQRAMDIAGAVTTSEMSEGALDDLLGDLNLLHDRAQCVCDPDDAPPAR